MICARHNAIATHADDHGWPLCVACFREAKALADRLAGLRLSSADALLRRLGGRQ